MTGPAGDSDRDVLEAMRDTLTHRGPDDAGLWISPDRKVGMGHRRLSILDLSEAGHQPMLSPQQDIVLVFNGEIYNHHELREEMQHRGIRFRSHCDTEVLLEAWRMWGEDCLEKLDGMFAFGLYDCRGERLVLARDRAGEKPLFYRWQQGRLRFASELKALMAEPGFVPEIDAGALNHYLAYGYVPADLCMLEGVSKLPPGCMLSVDLGDSSIRLRRYWQLPAGPSAQSGDADDLADRLEAMLETSVRRRLEADVPVGILLSGGLDSSLVTAMAARVSSGTVKTFTISFPGHGRYDEGPYARIVAEHFGTEHTELHAEPATVDLLPMLARQVDEPMADSSIVPTFLVSRMIRQHATVALGGDGGDELFGGYPSYRWVQRMARLRRPLPKALRSGLRRVALRGLRLGRPGRNAVLSLFHDDPGGCAQVNTFFDPAWRAYLLGDSLRRGLRKCIHGPEVHKRSVQQGPSLLRRMTSMDFQTYLPDDILVKVDRASMQTSLEVRAPMLDHRIIEFAFRDVPDVLRASDREAKVLLRHLGRRCLPERLDLKRKQGFMLPLQSWSRGAWGRFCEDVVRQIPETLCRREATDRLLREQRMGFRHTQRIFALCMLELWRREYAVRLPQTVCDSCR